MDRKMNLYFTRLQILLDSLVFKLFSVIHCYVFRDGIKGEIVLKASITVKKSLFLNLKMAIRITGKVCLLFQ